MNCQWNFMLHGNADAMYLAGLLADENKISKGELEQWANEAYYYGIFEYTVPWVASESKFGFELGLEWIDSVEEGKAAAGWATLEYYISIKQDEELDIAIYNGLLNRVEKNIHEAQNRVRFTMNQFVIAVGINIVELTKKASEVAEKIGKVTVDIGGTACKVPLATEYIKQVVNKGYLGKKSTPAHR